MKTYLVGYDLNKPGQNYAKLVKALEEDFDNWWHHLDSTWIIKTNMTAMEIVNKLQATTAFDSNDELLVVRLQGEWASFGFGDQGVEWLKGQVSLD